MVNTFTTNIKRLQVTESLGLRITIVLLKTCTRSVTTRVFTGHATLSVTQPAVLSSDPTIFTVFRTTMRLVEKLLGFCFLSQ